MNKLQDLIERIVEAKVKTLLNEGKVKKANKAKLRSMKVEKGKESFSSNYLGPKNKKLIKSPLGGHVGGIIYGEDDVALENYRKANKKPKTQDPKGKLQGPKQKLP